MRMISYICSEAVHFWCFLYKQTHFPCNRYTAAWFQGPCELILEPGPQKSVRNTFSTLLTQFISLHMLYRCSGWLSSIEFQKILQNVYRLCSYIYINWNDNTVLSCSTSEWSWLCAFLLQRVEEGVCKHHMILLNIIFLTGQIIFKNPANSEWLPDAAQTVLLHTWQQGEAARMS